MDLAHPLDYKECFHVIKDGGGVPNIEGAIDMEVE